MKIIEIFKSIQGEGILTGVPTTFVRLAGCNTKCTWCDQKEAWDETKSVDIKEDKIAEAIEEAGCGDVCFTGGEPMLQSNDIRTVTSIQREKFRFSIETNGSVYDPIPAIGFMSLSPKLQFWPHETFPKWMVYCYSFNVPHQIKVVCNTIEECDKAVSLVGEYADFLVLQPRYGSSSTNDIITFCINNGLRLSLQVHKLVGIQ